jgi:hypothetical protein
MWWMWLFSLEEAVSCHVQYLKWWGAILYITVSDESIEGMVKALLVFRVVYNTYFWVVAWYFLDLTGRLGLLAVNP